MSTTPLAPRVRILVVCDEVVPSEREDGVFTLGGVRQHFTVGACRLSLFLVLSSPRKDSCQGKILVVHAGTDRAVCYAKIQVAFEEDNAVLPLHVDLGSCRFPQPGPYTVQVWFSSQDGPDVLGGELPLDVWPNQE
jgi:hypothetical protein